MCVFLAAKHDEYTIPKSLRKFRKDCEKCFEFEEFYDLEAIIL